jgi:dihydroneopterin aldolase
MPDKIIVSAIDCVAAIGVGPEERALRHRLSVDIEVSTDTRIAAGSDSLEDAIDYSGIVSLVSRLAGEREYHLIETLAERIAGRVLSDCGGDSVTVRVRKMPPPLEARVGFVAVEVVRSPGGTR